MSTNPEISVILPTYNHASVVREAVQSVLDQSFTDFELIIVDDGSTDNTGDIIRDIDDRRLSPVSHPRNRGAAAARNTGIRAARGRFIAFQDSDDLWLPHKLQCQMNLLAQAPADVGVVFCPYRRRYPDGHEEIIGRQPAPGHSAVYKNVLRGSHVGAPTILIRKTCFNHAGLFDECLPRFQDWELMIRMGLLYTFAYIDEPLVIASVTRSTMTMPIDAAMETAERTILTKHMKTFVQAGRSTAAHRLWHFSHLLFMRNKPREGRVWLARALKARVTPLYCTAFALSFCLPLYRGLYRSFCFLTGRRILASHE